ncbi:MAG TPA: fibronectin type III domain-containing protein [Vicinamibacterales bacterium]|nr:fibronectin type III domain-containing protein [Vicinamibacterales bacterium]
MKAVVVLATIVATVACGKKGPPLAPFVRVPATVANVTAQRIDQDVYLSFPVPAANVDGQQPADIAALEVYAVTSARPPATEEHRDVATLVATVPVRPILPDPVPVNGSAPPPVPLPPGIDRGATAVVRETLTFEAYTPVELPLDERERALRERDFEADAGVAPFGPLVAPPPTQFPRRHYFVVGVSPRGRKSDPSTPVSVPLEAVSSAPGAPKLNHDDKAITITWPPSPDARTSTWVLPPPKPTGSVEAAAGREGGPKPSGPPPLTARSLGFNTEATLYHLYDVSTNTSPADPSAIVLPAPLTATPVAVTEWVIPAVEFGVERCFEVRPIDKVGDALVIGPASPRSCITPVDKFPPSAPRNLAAIAGSGSINLIWDANTEADIAGYLVLRAEAPSATLQPITPEPVASAAYRDETVKPGVRYVYSVVAVDRAGNRSAESDRYEETAR